MERLKFKGRRQEKQLEASKLELSIKGLRSSIRNNLDPFVDVSELSAELVTEQAFELADKQIAYNALLADIKAINRELGE